MFKTIIDHAYSFNIYFCYFPCLLFFCKTICPQGAYILEVKTDHDRLSKECSPWLNNRLFVRVGYLVPLHMTPSSFSKKA